MRFWWFIHEDGPQTYYEFLNRTEKHISTEEATSDQEEARTEPHPTKCSVDPCSKKGIQEEKSRKMLSTHRSIGHNMDDC